MNENSGEIQNPKRGNIYTIDYNEFFIVGQINNDDLRLISLHSGNRFSDTSIFGEGDSQFTKVNSPFTVYPDTK